MKLDLHIHTNVGSGDSMIDYRELVALAKRTPGNMNAGGNQKQLVGALRELAYVYESDGKIKEAMDTWTTITRYAPGAS